MLDPLHILADDDDVFGKVVFGIIAVIIWGFSALASWISKQQQEAKRQRTREKLHSVDQRLAAPPPIPRQIAEGLTRRHPEVLMPPAPPPTRRAPMRPVPVRPAPVRPRATQAPPLPLPVPTRPRSMPPKGVRKPVRQQSPVEAPILELSEETETPHLPRGALPQTVLPAAIARTPLANASTIRQWLNPQTLRSQFILTELLQPPLALREPRE